MATTPITTPTTTVGPRNIFERSMLLSIERSKPKLSKTVSSTVVNSTADQRMVHVQKSLYDSVELRRIFNLESSFDSYLKTRCFAFPLKTGIYLLPDDLFPEVEQALVEHQTRLRELVDAFGNVFEAAVQEAQDKLGSLFDPNDYPTVEQMKASFQFSWNYLEVSVAGRLQQLRRDIAQRESEKMQARIVDAAEAVNSMLRASMKVLVDGMVEKLSPKSDGKRKVFRTASLDKINDFLNLFPARNLAGDTDLAELVSKAKKLTEGISVEDIKTNEELRSSLENSFNEIKVELDKLVENAPIRSIELE